MGNQITQMLSKFQAQQRVDQVSAFKRELTDLESERVFMLATDAKQKLLEYHQQLLQQLSTAYDVDITQPSKNLSLGMQVASHLGALALGSSVFFLFYKYWAHFNTVAQAVILIGVSLLSLVITAVVSSKEKSGYLPKSMAIVSFFCFALNIYMFSHIFNLPETNNAFLVWCLYAGILAYAVDSCVLLGIGICFFYVFVASSIGEWFGLYWVSMASKPENYLLPAIFLTILPSVISHKGLQYFASVYHVMGTCGLLLTIFILSNWGAGSYLLADSDTIKTGYQLLGFIACGALIILGTYKSIPAFVNTGCVFFVIFLYAKFVDWWWELLPKYLFFFIIGVTAFLILSIFKSLRAKPKSQKREALS